MQSVPASSDSVNCRMKKCRNPGHQPGIPWMNDTQLQAGCIETDNFGTSRSENLAGNNLDQGAAPEASGARGGWHSATAIGCIDQGAVNVACFIPNPGGGAYRGRLFQLEAERQAEARLQREKLSIWRIGLRSTSSITGAIGR
jgi:hypothetical protein